MATYENSLFSGKVNSSHFSSNSRRVIRVLKIPHIGTITQLNNGDIEIQYSDYSRVIVNSTSAKVTHCSFGKMEEFTQNDVIPSDIRKVLAHMPRIIDALKSHS